MTTDFDADIKNFKEILNELELKTHTKNGYKFSPDAKMAAGWWFFEIYMEQEFARRIRQEELSKPGYELYQRYLYRTKGGGLGGVNAQTLGAALLYSASKLRGGKLRMTYLSEKLKVSYEPLVKMVNKIEDVMAEWRMS